MRHLQYWLSVIQLQACIKLNILSHVAFIVYLFLAIIADETS